MTDFPFAVLGWTLIHFVWQGALIGVVTQAALSRRTDSRQRYAIALVALVLMPGVLIATFLWLAAHSSGGGALQSGPSRDPRWLLLIVAAWSLGVFVLATRALIGLWLVHDLRRHSTPLPAEWLAICQALREMLSVVLPVAFRLSDRIQSPVAAGWFRPMVLLPASVLLGLPADQFEALILHELAHLKRFDPFVNLLQIGLETVLFYHPAVWRISRIIRAEREHCCDDMAARALGDPAIVAHALHSVASLRAAPSFALAANGGAVKMRIARLLGLAPVDEPPAVYWLAMISLMLALTLGSTLVWRGSAVSAAPQPPAASFATPAPSAPKTTPATSVKPRTAPRTKISNSVSAAAAAIDQSAIEARLDQLQTLMDTPTNIGRARFMQSQEEKAIRAEIANLRHPDGAAADAPDAG